MTEIVERSALEVAKEAVRDAADAYDELAADEATTDEELAESKRNLDTAIAEADRLEQRKQDQEHAQRARERFQPVPGGERQQVTPQLAVREPDMYSRSKPTFLRDLYMYKLKGDLLAGERIQQHHAFEMEKRAVATAGLGGIIPPQYLVDLYAKAPRNGRVFFDQVNRDDPLPDVGMSLIIPRLTAGTSAAAQTSENTAVSTQDPTEVDLTVPVRTVAGYVPVSRQTLERASYSEAILFEDLVARYYAALDVNSLNGSGVSGQMLGLLQTAGLATSVAGAATMTSVWPKLADVIQQINSNVGGLGYYADKIVMHPRRWGWFEAQLDSAGRPIFGINGMDNYAPAEEGMAAGYGPVGRAHGLPVFTDANIPTNFHTDEDAIIIMASRVVHGWERPEDPITLSFEQQAGTSLQVQLIAYGYAAFTAGRYPGASGYVYGAGLTTPSFGS